jgi:hypothetical protein
VSSRPVPARVLVWASRRAASLTEVLAHLLGGHRVPGWFVERDGRAVASEDIQFQCQGVGDGHLFFHRGEERASKPGAAPVFADFDVVRE